MVRYRKDDRDSKKHNKRKKISFREKRDVSPTFKNTNKYVNLENPLSKRAHKFCMKQSGYKNHKIVFKRIIKSFLRELKKCMLENEAGVFIEGLGYFCILRDPRVWKDSTTRPLSDGHLYLPTFIPIRKDRNLQQWTMDRAFFKDIISGVKNKVVEGHKYKMAFTLLNNIYSNSKVTLKEK